MAVNKRSLKALYPLSTRHGHPLAAHLAESEVAGTGTWGRRKALSSLGA